MFNQAHGPVGLRHDLFDSLSGQGRRQTRRGGCLQKVAPLYFVDLVMVFVSHRHGEFHLFALDLS